ncbi:glycosyltransferase family 2 protein [Streptococcus cristatus]
MGNAITFIIVTWNSQDEILPCLDSIKRHSPKHSKIIVVDNASSDKTVSIIRKNFKDVKVIASEDNLGFAKANNLALAEVVTDYTCFINPDVILTEDIVAPSIEILLKNQKIGLVACQLKNPDGSHQPSCFRFATPHAMFSEILHLGKVFPMFIRRKFFNNYYLAEKPYSPDWVIGAEMVMRTAEARKIEGFSTEYFMYTEDMDLCKKIAENLNKSVLFLPTVSLIHVGGASEAQNINYNKQRKLFENTFLFVEKFYGKNEADKTYRSMMLAYRIREVVLRLGYWKNDRHIQIKKTKRSLTILKEIR